VTTPGQVHNWDALAAEDRIAKTIKALEANKITPIVVNSGAEATQKIYELIPEGAEVFTATSATLQPIGLVPEINESGRYISVRKQIMALNRETQAIEIRRLGATPEYVVGSIHAVTEQGSLSIASFGGSQLAPYVFGAGKAIWVVGTNKLVKDMDEGFQRIEQRSLPLESERLQKAVGRQSEIGKVLIIRKEANPTRSTVILVKENLGF
jgi:hypothetical protein